MTFEPSWEDKAIRGLREGELPFPEATIIARLAWSYEVIDSMVGAAGFELATPAPQAIGIASVEGHAKW